MEDNRISRQFSQPQYGDLGVDEVITPIFPLGVMPTMENWLGVRVDLLRRWKAVLGTPSFGSFDRKQEPVGGANSQPIRELSSSSLRGLIRFKLCC